MLNEYIEKKENKLKKLKEEIREINVSLASGLSGDKYKKALKKREDKDKQKKEIEKQIEQARKKLRNGN